MGLIDRVLKLCGVHLFCFFSLRCGRRIKFRHSATSRRRLRQREEGHGRIVGCIFRGLLSKATVSGPSELPVKPDRALEMVLFRQRRRFHIFSEHQSGEHGNLYFILHFSYFHLHSRGY